MVTMSFQSRGFSLQRMTFSSRGHRASDDRVVLVVTTIHPPDDPRVRERTVGALATRARVRYACKEPGPSRQDDHEWLPLRGGRVRRAWEAARASFVGDVDSISFHDPELLPLALLVRLVRRIHVVYDVHEDLPGQLMDKEWAPVPLRAPLAKAAALMLQVAETQLTLTLAEAGYQRRFRRSHPVLPNYPDVQRLPAPSDAHDGTIVYVGDIREVRGAMLTVEAVAEMASPAPLVMVGRCLPALRERLVARARELGVELTLPGFLPHAEAMAIVRRAAVGISPLFDIANYRWSLPTKVLEYLALGVPVVASDLPGTSEVVAGLAGVRLVPPGDSRSLADALSAVLGDPTIRAEARAAAPSVRERFSWPAEDLRAVYLGPTSR